MSWYLLVYVEIFIRHFEYFEKENVRNVGYVGKTQLIKLPGQSYDNALNKFLFNEFAIDMSYNGLSVNIFILL